MIEYHKLENEILILFKNNNSEDENEVNKMNILVASLFTILYFNSCCIIINKNIFC